MKSNFKAKLLQHRVSDRGFTLIEVLTVVIIISLLAAISYPSLLSQANKAKQSEAKQYVGTLNRSQQAYFLEKNEFAPDMASLINPVPESTNNYDYTFKVDTDSVINYGKSKGEALKSYAGMAAIAYIDSTSDATTTAILCEAIAPGAVQASDPLPPVIGSGNRPTCGEGAIGL